MKLQILHVPDCPNVAVLSARIAEVLDGRRDVEVDQVVVADQDVATAVGMTGSPTLLVDGLDPFAEAGPGPSVSCRLYLDETGAVAGCPSTSQLRAVLAGHRLPTGPRAGPTLAGWRTAGTGSRQAGLPSSLRQVHQGVLRHFLTVGEAPDRSWLTEQARGVGLDAATAIRELTAADLVHLDDDGRVAVAYPFSGRPSRHRVRLAGGPAAWAMCAIDALGIPQMADRDATITATDPSTGEQIIVEAQAGHWHWAPASTVVLIAQTGEGGPSAECTCEHINFHSRPEHAQTYLDTHAEVSGRIVDQTTAIDLAYGIFGGLLREKA